MGNTYELDGHVLINNGHGVYEPQEEMRMQLLGVDKDILIFYDPVDGSEEDIVIGVVLKGTPEYSDLEYLNNYQDKHSCWKRICQSDPERFRYAEEGKEVAKWIY